MKIPIIDVGRVHPKGWRRLPTCQGRRWSGRTMDLCAGILEAAVAANLSLGLVDARLGDVNGHRDAQTYGELGNQAVQDTVVIFRLLKLGSRFFFVSWEPAARGPRM